MTRFFLHQEALACSDERDAKIRENGAAARRTDPQTR